MSDMSLRSILNMDNLFKGGLKTEYGLYALSTLAKAGVNYYDFGAIGILEDLSKINFHELNDKNNANQHNEHIIIDVMYDVANQVLKNIPGKIETVCQIMTITENNNKRFVNEAGRSRKEFMQSYAELFEKCKEREYKLKEKKELENRIKANKKAILERRAEKKEAQELFVGNKDKKIYTIDDLEFNDDDTASLKLYNGLEFLVKDYDIYYNDDYGIEIRSGGKSIRTDLSAKYGNHSIRFEDNILRVNGIEKVAEVLKYAQLLDADGKLCRDPHVVSGVVAADKIADGIRSGIIAGTVNHKRGRIMAENVKMKWLKQKNQKG
jgi:hypothetical protein